MGKFMEIKGLLYLLLPSYIYSTQIASSGFLSSPHSYLNIMSAEQRSCTFFFACKLRIDSHLSGCEMLNSHILIQTPNLHIFFFHVECYERIKLEEMPCL